MVEIRLQLWEFAMESHFESFLKPHLINSSGIVVIFDLSNKHSFYTSTLERMIEFIKKECNPEFILVGNKTDLKTLETSDINSENIKKFQDRFDILKFITASAKTGENVKIIFETLVQHIISKKIAKLEIDLSRDSSLILKILVIGLNGVGKTSIITRYIENKYSESYQTTIGAMIKTKKIQFEPKKEIK